MLRLYIPDWLYFAQLPRYAALFALLAAAPAIHAQGEDVFVVGKVVETFRHALLTKDRAQLEALCADQLSYGHGDGRTETKKQFIDDAVGSRTVWRTLEFASQTIVIDENIAVVRNVLIGENERDSKSSAVKNGILMVWRKQDGRWTLLARQSYRM